MLLGPASPTIGLWRLEAFGSPQAFLQQGAPLAACMTGNDEPRAEPNHVARRVRYAGRVQGVGFRYTTADIAEQYSVTGYVKNLADGGVEVYAEGSPTDVHAFLDAVSARWKRNIHAQHVEELPATGQYPRFRITY
jgi:acylphosphatase